MHGLYLRCWLPRAAVFISELGTIQRRFLVAASLAAAMFAVGAVQSHATSYRCGIYSVADSKAAEAGTMLSQTVV
jgi:hypothetical protein